MHRLKLYLVLLSLVLIPNAFSSSEKSIESADQQYEKKLYQSALPEYLEILKDNKSSNFDKALLRAVQCQAHLSKPIEAIQILEQIQPPDNKLTKYKALVLQVELSQTVQQQSRRYHQSPERDLKNTDITRRSAKEWQDRIDGLYGILLKDSDALKNINVISATDIMDLENADLELTPTLYDFVVHLRLENLRTDHLYQDETPTAQEIWQDKPALPIAAPATKAQVLLLDAKANRIPGDTNAAQEYWALQQILLPTKWPDKIRVTQDFSDQLQKKLKLFIVGAKASRLKADATYELASLLNNQEKYTEAVSACESIKDFPKSNATVECQKLVGEIRNPILQIATVSAAPPATHSISVQSRNLKKIFFSIFKIQNPLELDNSRAGFRGTNEVQNENFNFLRYAGFEVIEKYISTQKPFKEWDFTTDDKGSYLLLNQKASPPKLDVGFYLIVASNERVPIIKQSLISATYLNVTDFFLFNRLALEGDPEDLLSHKVLGNPQSSAQKNSDEQTVPALQTLAVDGKTGMPLEGVNVQIRKFNAFGSTGETKDLRKVTPAMTSRFGQLKTSIKMNVRPEQSSNGTFDIFAEKNSRFAYIPMPISFYFSQENPLRVFVETDRPIYRPGQTVKGKITVFERIPYGFRTVNSGEQIEVKARNPNTEFFSKKVSTNTNGSASFEFEIPKSGLLGNYSVKASYANQNLQASQSSVAGFSVEEYKRPEFEIKLNDTKSITYNSSAEISGHLKYYFGGAVSDGVVKYRVEQRAHIPWYCWWYWGPTPPPKFIAEGSIKTGREGEFKFSFTPKAMDEVNSTSGASDLPSLFQISIEARDSGGRTIAANKSFFADSKEFNIVLNSDRGFFRENSDVKIKTQLLDLTGKEYSANLQYEVFELDKPHENESQKKLHDKFLSPLPTPPQPLSLVQLYSGTPSTRKIRSGNLSIKAGDKSELTLSPLPEGAYRIRFTTKDQNLKKVEGQYVFLVVGNLKKLSQLDLPSLTLTEKAKYQPAEKASVLVGASSLSSPLFFDILKSRFVLESKIVGGKGLRLVEIPIAKKHSRGFSVHWQAAENFEIFEGQTQIDVPADSKKLNLSVVYPKEMLPGQSQKWTLHVEDSNRNKVAAEASLRVFDRSLEYYRNDDTITLFSSLYPSSHLQVDFRNSIVNSNGTSLPIEKGLLSEFYKLMNQWISPPKFPTLFIQSDDVYMRGNSRFAMSDGALAGAMSGPAAMSEKATAKGNDKSASNAAEIASTSQSTAPEPRHNFAETGFFNSQILAPQGVGIVHFNIPEQLTSWRILASAHTRDGKVGNFSAESVTRKNLMVRAEIPRFLRESDQSFITAVVHNESAKSLNGQVKLEILLGNSDQAKNFGLKDLSLNFQVSAHSHKPFTWKVVTPTGISTYKIRVTVLAKSNETKQMTLTDSEERELPVLPSRERLIESTFAALSGNVQKSLMLTSFSDVDSTQSNERIDVKIEPQLALSILNSLPFLIQYPCEGTEQIVNRYVPLAIVHGFFSKFPKLADTVAKIPKRKTISPAWSSDDPQRLIHLAESPWVQQAKGSESEYPVTDLLNPQLVALEKERSLSDLGRRQLPSGGFPWYPGGKEDLFITLNVLEGLAQAKIYGIEIPKNLADQAINYVMQKVPELLTSEHRDLTTLMYSSFILSSFGSDFTLAKERSDFTQKAMQFADKNSKNLAPIGLAYAAWIYNRLNDKAHAESYLARALDGSAKDPVSGVYWAPEKNSWLWYNDSVGKHAFFLRVLLMMHPEDKRIPGMVQWLLFNRKGNEWKSTRASAAAIYSLLDFMKSTGSLDRTEEFELTWGNRSEGFKVEALNWLAQPFSFSKTGPNITPDDREIKLRKQGPGLTFASATRIYSTEKIQSSSGPNSESVLKIERKYFLRSSLNGEMVLLPLQSGDKIHVGDQVEVQIKINSNSQFEYLHLKDPRGAGFESEVLTSEWSWDSLARYEEPRDSLMNFFVSWLPHGEYVLRHRMRATTPGSYRIGSALLQSMYAPEFTARSSGMILNVE